MTPPAADASRQFVRRFSRYDRASHVALMVSFLGLAATGMPLLFSSEAWAGTMARMLGGFRTAGLIHRGLALLLIAVFAAHLGKLAYRFFAQRDRSMPWGPTSMVPQPRDLTEMLQHFQYFLGKAPRPAFDPFTYWEKFDYWAVFWGMFIIGGSGLLLWFPTFFAQVVPGWLFNIALLVHGEEALLAVGFIFTVHFFNGHLRPEKFPMDLVIFTGLHPTHELHEERAGELERLSAHGTLDRVLAPEPKPVVKVIGALIGTTAVIIGLSLVGLILYAVLA